MKNLVNLQSIKKMFSVRVIKVTLALFIFASLMMNIIAPKNIENKEQIIGVVCFVLNNVIVKTIRGCTDTLIVMSNKITRDLYKLMLGDEVGTKVPVKNEKKEETPVNTSSDIGIEMSGRIYKELVRYTQDNKEPVVLYVGKTGEKLYRLYCSVKVYCGQLHSVFMLFFIIFIVAIRERKEDIVNQINIALKNKTNLC